MLFGHHFAAIAGAGPLVGPVLAAQMGYLPGLLWLIVGVVLAGAVQDFMVLFISSRRDGRSLGDLVREEMGPVAGTIALFGAFMIMIIILAVLAMIVVKALAESPWGMFTVMATMPHIRCLTMPFMGISSPRVRKGWRRRRAGSMPGGRVVAGPKTMVVDACRPPAGRIGARAGGSYSQRTFFR